MSRARPVLVLAFLATMASGCGRCGGDAPASGSSGGATTTAGLSADEAKRVLVKVGDRTITVADYAGVLERMGPYERMRYQAPERRKELLDDMITVELLAAEATAQGYDKDPLTAIEIQTALRDAMLADLRKDAPKPEAISADHVRAWYTGHADLFKDPERRRLAAIAVKTRAEATALIAELPKDPSAVHFGTLVRQKSILEDAKADVPPDLAGDLGIVSPPGDSRGPNARVPEPVRAAAYAIAKAGDIGAEPVEANGGFYVVRLVQVLEARARTYEEAERSIRVRLAQEELTKQEDDLVAELRKKTPVTIDEAALANVHSAPVPSQAALTPPDAGAP